MSALPADVARFANDGYLIVTDPVAGAAMKDDHPDARPSDGEIEMFFVNPDHAQMLLDEKFAYLSNIGPLHLGIKVEESLGIGTSLAIAPTVPSFRCVDDAHGVDVVARLRAYSHDMGTDQFSVEVIE